MKKINEQTKSFLLYGIEDVIKPKEIYKLDGAILFLVFLFFFLSESAPSPFFSKVFLVIVYLGFVILSFSRTEVTGKKVFWIIGIQSLTFSILFCWAATILMLTTMKEEYYKRYLTILVIIYILVIAAYIFLIIMSLRGTFFSETTPIMLRNSGIVVETDKFLLTSKLILTPFTSFILVSVIRKCIDAKRPYEKYNIKPLFVKDTKGDSMPSRHVFSITIIAMCWLYVSVPVGIIMLMLVAIMAASRVLAGVHFVRDVVAGFAVGIICGIAGLWII